MKTQAKARQLTAENRAWLRAALPEWANLLAEKAAVIAEKSDVIEKKTRVIAEQKKRIVAIHAELAGQLNCSIRTGTY